MTVARCIVTPMRISRQVSLGVVLLLAMAGMALAAVGSLLAMGGMRLPGGMGDAISAAATALAWLRWISVIALVWGVARARQDSC